MCVLDVETPKAPKAAPPMAPKAAPKLADPLDRNTGQMNPDGTSSRRRSGLSSLRIDRSEGVGLGIQRV